MTAVLKRPHTEQVTSSPMAHGDHRDEPVFEVEPPDISGIAIEDDEPVDNLYSEKQMRLLTEPLYDSWHAPVEEGEESESRFLATANVGVFASPHEPPLVPDVLLSVGVAVHRDMRSEMRHRTYFIWEFGKPPDVVIEVVSNTEGDELGKRYQGYARMGVTHYIVWDPDHNLGPAELHAFALNRGRYVPSDPAQLGSLGLGLLRWEGEFEGYWDVWLRWARPDGTLIPTGTERANTERARADRLAEMLREQGIDPDEL